VATYRHSSSRAQEPHRGVAEDLVELAGTPDDDSSIPARLLAITRSAAGLPEVSYASVTGHHEGAPTTVAMSDEIALAVDQAQYADGTGPCLDALETGSPRAVPEIDATVQWPGFRQEAHRLGLRSSLSIPVFAGRGVVIAALNLYGRDPGAMAPLSAAVLATYDSASDTDPELARKPLDPRARELIDGLTGAFAVRTTIQRAIGVLIAQRVTNADTAYAILRARAAETGAPLAATAHALVTQTAEGHVAD
jgi:hypothetical protein